MPPPDSVAESVRAPTRAKFARLDGKTVCKRYFADDRNALTRLNILRACQRQSHLAIGVLAHNQRLRLGTVVFKATYSARSYYGDHVHLEDRQREGHNQLLRSGP